MSNGTKRSESALGSKSADVFDTLGRAVHVEPLSHCQAPGPVSPITAMPGGTGLPSRSAYFASLSSVVTPRVGLVAVSLREGRLKLCFDKVGAVLAAQTAAKEVALNGVAPPVPVWIRLTDVPGVPTVSSQA